MSRLFTLAFWQMVGWAVLRTALAALVPAIPALVNDPTTAWLPALLTVGLIVVITIATLLAGLPSTDSGTWWAVAAQRAVRQFGQYVAGAAVGGVLLTDFDWRLILTAALASALSTFILAALTLVPSLDAAVIADGEVATGTLPVVVTINNTTQSATDVAEALDESTEGTEGLPEPE